MPSCVFSAGRHHLGHNSKAIHRAYAKKAQVILPPLEEYEKKIIPLQLPHAERNNAQHI
jgi:hypothetical protein